jgi:hypothetical protein
LVDVMRQHNPELYAHVEDFEERAAIAQYCSGFPRAAAEALARACILAEPLHGGCAACGYPDITGAT